MPALPDVPNCAKVIVAGSYGGRTFNTILHCKLNVAPGDFIGQTDMDALATGLRLAYKNNILPLQANGFNLTTVEAVELLALGGLTSTASGSDPGGDSSTGNMPNSVAAVISWTEAAHYRGGHPRSYIGGLKQTTAVNTFQWTGTFIAGLNAGATAFRAAVNAVGGARPWQLGCVHYHGKVLTTPGVPVFLPFTGNAVHPRIDTQRRRLGKE